MMEPTTYEEKLVATMPPADKTPADVDQPCELVF
jgi:hypothetical protein|nr:MAG TPA: hypothetical protein [Caudoviricetes sp.]